MNSIFNWFKSRSIKKRHQCERCFKTFYRPEIESVKYEYNYEFYYEMFRKCPHCGSQNFIVV